MRDTASPTEADDGPSGLLERTLGVLELLSANAKGLQLYAIADHLKMPRSATHRVLTALVEKGYMRQDRSGGVYLLTARLASLAFTFLASSGVTDFAQPILDRVAQVSGELARLALVDGRALIWVAKAEGKLHGHRYDPDTGQIGRLSCSASGQAWLSCLAEAEALALVEQQGFGRRVDYGPRAPETPAALLKLVRQARKRGFSMAIQSYSPWINGMAAPVRQGGDGEVIGTLAITGAHLRLTEPRMMELAPLLLEAARELAVALAATPGVQRSMVSKRAVFFAGNTSELEDRA